VSDNFHDLAEENAVLAKHLSGQAEAIGYVLIPRAQHEALMAAAKELETIREEAVTCGKMCCIYAEEPDANGQKSMSGCIVDSVAPFLVSIAYPLREMCRHGGLDKQAGICRQCGIHEEDIAVLRAAGIPEGEPND
jgi:hypothetical protein